MKNTLLSITFLIITTLQAQPFSIIIHKPFNSELFDIKEDYDRTLSAVGITRNFKNNANTQESYDNIFDFLASRSQSYGAQIAFIKANNQAQVLINTSAKLPRFNTAVSILKTPTNGSFIGGYTMDGELLVAKLSPQAHPIAYKLFGTKNFDRLSKIIPLSDGGILAVGSSITSRDTHDDMFQTGLGNSDIYLTRFDKNLQMHWSKKYGTIHDDVGIDAAEAQDGSIVVISTTAYEKHKDVTLMRITENGDRIWLKHYKKEGLIVPKRIIHLRDNNFVVALTQYTQNHHTYVRLIKFDLYENILFDKEHITRNNTEINDIAEFSDGSLVAVGKYTQDANSDGVALLFNGRLDFITSKNFGTRNYDVFHALAILHNGDVAIAGAHSDTHSQESNMWIVKLHRDLSPVEINTQHATTPYTNKQLQQLQNNLYNELQTVFAKEIANKQLLITPDLQIIWQKEPLLFQVGAYKLTNTQQKFLDSFSDKLFSVLLHYKADIATLEINGHTSREWGNTTFTHRYLNNQDLSMKRAYSVMKYIFQNQNTTQQHWLSTILKGSGDGFRPHSNLLEVTAKQQRHVSFQIYLK
jgi:outer membrane protein OmpA-like peptidoglycan-associated protein